MRPRNSRGPEAADGVRIQRRVVAILGQIEDSGLAALAPSGPYMEIKLYGVFDLRGRYQACNAGDLRRRLESADDPVEPPLVDPHVIVSEGNEIGRSLREATVACA